MRKPRDHKGRPYSRHCWRTPLVDRGDARMIIEWHTHVYPAEEAAVRPLWGGRCPMTVENVVAAHHKAGLAVSVVSNAAHYLRGKDAKDELSAIARWSDYAAEIQDAHPGTLYCLAMATPCGGPAHLKELERAIRQLNLKGVLINSSHKSHYPDDDEARGFWELVQDLDIPVMIHPPHVGFGEERIKEYGVGGGVGGRAGFCGGLWGGMVGGILEDFPGVKMVGSHGGGGICEVIGRLDYAYELQDEAFFLGSYGPMRIRHAPSHYLRMMYFDSVTYHVPPARLVLDTVGADPSLYGSDRPPLTSLTSR